MPGKFQELLGASVARAESAKGSVLGNEGRKGVGACAEKPELVCCIKNVQTGTSLVV